MADYEWKHELNKEYPKGTRIGLERMDDPYRDMPAGLQGTVRYVDDAGQIQMLWDNGSSLALIPGVDSFRKLPPEHQPRPDKTDIYIRSINAHILPFIDYPALHRSYETDMAYAKGILRRLHDAMIAAYGSEKLYEVDSGDGFVLIPGVLRSQVSGRMCLALLELDLSSGGEHWGTSYLCKYGVIPEGIERLASKGAPVDAVREMNRLYIPYDYGYTAVIPNDIHIRKSSLPEPLRDVLYDFHNHSTDLLSHANDDAPDEPEYGDDE